MIEDNYIVGYDSYDEDAKSSVGVKEVLNFKDLSYCLEINGEIKETKFLSKEEALSKFGYCLNKFEKEKLRQGIFGNINNNKIEYGD